MFYAPFEHVGYLLNRRVNETLKRRRVSPFHQVLFQIVIAGGITPPGYFKTSWVEGLTVDFKVEYRRPGPEREIANKRVVFAIKKDIGG